MKKIVTTGHFLLALFCSILVAGNAIGIYTLYQRYQDAIPDEPVEVYTKENSTVEYEHPYSDMVYEVMTFEEIEKIEVWEKPKLKFFSFVPYVDTIPGAYIYLHNGDVIEYPRGTENLKIYVKE